MYKFLIIFALLFTSLYSCKTDSKQKIDRVNIERLISLGNNSIENKAFDQALVYFDSIANIIPDSPIPYFHKAKCYMQTEEYHKAALNAKAGLLYKLDDKELYDLLLVAYKKGHENEEYLKAASERYNKDDSSIENITFYVDALITVKKYDEAKIIIQKGKALFPNNNDLNNLSSLIADEAKL